MAAFCLSTLRNLPLEPESLDIELHGDARRVDRIQGWIDGNTSAFATLTVADLLYDAVRLDPLVIEGLDFARAANLADIFHLAGFAERIGRLEAAGYAGNLAQLQGYVAEHVVAHALVADGADVSFPATSNEPGWDLLVNGDSFQVKCLASPAGVLEHLSRYPDIPVIANRELAEAFADDDRVIILDSLVHSEVVARTQGTLDAAADLLDAQVPLFAGVIGAVRAGAAVLRKDSDLATAAQSAAFTAVAGGGGAMTGGAAAAAGIAALGVTGGWVAIIAPVFGGIGGYRLGSAMADRVKAGLVCRAEAGALVAATQDFAGAAVHVLARMIASSQRFKTKVGLLRTGDSAFAAQMKAGWLKRVELELDRRAFFQKLMARAAADPRYIKSSTSDPRVHAAEVMWAASQGGILQANLRSETQAIKSCMANYTAALRQWLLR